MKNQRCLKQSKSTCFRQQRPTSLRSKNVKHHLIQSKSNLIKARKSMSMLSSPTLISHPFKRLQ